MLGIARSVTAVRTGSDLEARLEEAHRILRDRPPYNKALKQRGAGFYLELRWNEPFPRLRIVRRPRRAGALYIGPFWGRRLPRHASRLVEKIVRLRNCPGPIRPDRKATPCIQFDLGLCTGPCASLVGIDDYRRQAEAAAHLLTDAAYAHELRRHFAQRRDRASGELDFERAALHQARLDWLEELEEVRFAIEEDGDDRSWLIVLPGTTDRTRVILPVARGRVLRRRTVIWDETWPAAIEDACYEVGVAELRAPSVLRPAESVPSVMVKRWLEDGSPGGTSIDLTGLDTRDTIKAVEATGPRQPSPARVRASPRE